MGETIDEEARRLLAKFERSRWTEPGHPSTLGLILDAIRAGRLIGMRMEREAVAREADAWASAYEDMGDHAEAMAVTNLKWKLVNGDHHPNGDPLKE